jgi:hypothetical protein
MGSPMQKNMNIFGLFQNKFPISDNILLDDFWQIEWWDIFD